MEEAKLAEKPSLTLERYYPAAPERVWRAWTDPQALSRWFGPGGPLAATFLAIFFVPMFFKLFSDRHLTERRSTAQIKDEALQARLLALRTAEVPHHAPHPQDADA